MSLAKYYRVPLRVVRVSPNSREKCQHKLLSSSTKPSKSALLRRLNRRRFKEAAAQAARTRQQPKQHSGMDRRSTPGKSSLDTGRKFTREDDGRISILKIISGDSEDRRPRPCPRNYNKTLKQLRRDSVHVSRHLRCQKQLPVTAISREDMSVNCSIL